MAKFQFLPAGCKRRDFASRGARWTLGIIVGSLLLVFAATAEAKLPPPIQAASVTTPASGLGAGGKVKKWDVNGVTLEQRMPPPGFNFANASAAQRDYYGVPTNLPIGDLGRLSTKEIGSIQLDPGVTASSTGGEWAAQIANATGPTGEAATYYEPSPNFSVCNSTDQLAAYWTGLGGINGNALVQNGVWQEYDQAPSQYDNAIWAELLPSQGTSSPPGVGWILDKNNNPITFRNGDYIGLETLLDLQLTTSQDWAFEFIWDDTNTGNYQTIYGWASRSAAGWNGWVPNTGEFVVEHPAGPLTNMVDFGSVTAPVTETYYNGAWTYNKTWYTGNGSGPSPLTVLTGEVNSGTTSPYWMGSIQDSGNGTYTTDNGSC